MIDVMRKAVIVPIHRDGWPFIAAGLKTLLETGQPLIAQEAGASA